MRRIAAVFLSLLFLSHPLLAEQEEVGTQLAVAIEGGDLDAVKALIDGGAAVDTPIDYGDHSITPLIKAAWDGQLEIVQYLIARGAKVDALDGSTQGTALMNAVTNGHTEIVKALIAAKANVSLRDQFDFNAFTTAVAAGNQEIAALLLDAGAKPDEGASSLTPLAFAGSSGNVEMMRFLVSRGANVNHQAKGTGQTALISAIHAAQVDAVKTLIDLKADVNAAMADGTTPLRLARKGDQKEIVKLLLAAGAKK